MFEDGVALAKLFVFSDRVLGVLSNRMAGIDDFDQYTVVMSSAVFGQFTSRYLKYASQYSQVSIEERHKLLSKTTEMLIAVQTGTPGNWLLPLTRSIALALCNSASQTYNMTQDPASYADAASLLLRMLIDVLSDNSSPIESSKKLGALFVAGLLLRISIKTNGAPGAYASKALEAKALWKQPIFSKRDRVSYSYWLGRYHLVCYYVDQARIQLEYAFNTCPEWHFHNKQTILRHLLVANMIRGRLPSQRLLQKYEMEPVYLELTLHFKKGNLAGFQQTLQDNMGFFRSQGNYLILLERTEILIYRNVLQRLCRLNAHSERSAIVPYRDLLSAFQVSTQDTEMDVYEMESILASLVSQKLVLGYLFHHQRLINLSKKQPFPPILTANP